MFPHAEEEGLDIVNGLWVHQLPVIEHQADPEVVHENREPRHDRQYPPWTSKLVPKRQTSVINITPYVDNLLDVGVQELVCPFTLF